MMDWEQAILNGAVAANLEIGVDLKNELCYGSPHGKWVNNPLPPHHPNRLNHWDTWEGNVHQKGVKRIRMTCPVCKRRLMSSVRVCQDGCCIIHTLPPHKPKKWWKKGKRKDHDKPSGRKRSHR